MRGHEQDPRSVIAARSTQPARFALVQDGNYSSAMAHDASPARAIRAEEHDSYCVLEGRADAGLILLCDHAGNAIPPAYGTLGLPPEQLERHIAYDIGAAQVTRRLAAALGVPALLTRYSRLLIDPNRGADDPTLIMRLSDGAVIPGNRRLDDAERERRARLYYAPYHRAIAARHRPVPRQRRAADAAVDPLLHRELEGDAAALARGRALGPGPAARQAAARRLLRRGRPDRRRQRALLGPARGRLPVAARHLPRARQCPDRDPPGPDPRLRPARRPGRGDFAALSGRS